MNEDTRKVLTWFLTIAVVALAVVLGLYFYRFAPGSWFTLSKDSEEWARFGEYAGGTLGAAFGLLAFGGVLFTIREQRRQSVLEEFQRQMAVLHERVEAILSEEPAEVSPADLVLIQQVTKSISIYSLLRRAGIQAMRGHEKDAVLSTQHEQLREVAVPAIKRQVDVIQLELQHLVWCLEKYVDMGGNQTLIDLYTRRYQPIVCWINVLGMTESEPVRTWFQPERFYADWRAANLGTADSSATPESNTSA
jgi:hypothetical protein